MAGWEESAESQAAYARRHGVSTLSLARFDNACRRLVNKVRPKSLLGQAMTYALGQWSVLEVFRERGEIEIDNNRVENAIRPTAIGKKWALHWRDRSRLQIRRALLAP